MGIRSLSKNTNIMSIEPGRDDLELLRQRMETPQLD
jgi:hypothetical protein